MPPSQPAHAHVTSVNLGSGAPLGAPLDGQISGIDKRPVPQITVRDPGDRLTGQGSGVVGDVIAEREHHGGQRQALYLVAGEELSYWAKALGRDLPPGSFGENVTTHGVDVDRWVIGATVIVGEQVRLEVCGPRIPCATFAAHLGERGWAKRFTQHGRSGTYCAVRTPGTIVAGALITVADVPEHGIDIMRAFCAFSGDVDAAEDVLAAECLTAAEHEQLASRVARRTRVSRATGRTGR